MSTPEVVGRQTRRAPPSPGGGPDRLRGSAGIISPLVGQRPRRRRREPADHRRDLLLITIFFQSKNANFLAAGELQQPDRADVRDRDDRHRRRLRAAARRDRPLDRLRQRHRRRRRRRAPAARRQLDQFPGLVAIVVALLVGALRSALFQGSFVAFLGVPSFVVTLAGYLAFQGVILKRSAATGVIVIQDNTINNIANYFFSPIRRVDHRRDRESSSTSSWSLSRRCRPAPARHPDRQRSWLEIVKVAAVTAGAFFVAYRLTPTRRGVPFAGLLIVILLVFWTFVAKRTTFGRHVYAVGGNAEAARRAGINVQRDPLVRVHDLRRDGRRSAASSSPRASARST